MQTLATGLRFPEGPIAMSDGSVILVEIERGTLSRVKDGQVTVIAELGGGPNGAAMGPDGAIYVCNNGGFKWNRGDGMLAPVGTPDDYAGGRIERVDLKTGQFTTLYRECDGFGLNGPNDIVFDRQGGFWFTDLGKTYDRHKDLGFIYYAKADGSHISRQISHRDSPNGIGLSPDENKVYFAETQTGRVWSCDLIAPGQVDASTLRLVAGLPGFQLLDSMAIDANGNICVATLMNGGITVISPDGSDVKHIPMDDRFTTNICFGGKDLRTAFITLSGTGRLVAVPWVTAGLPLNFLNR